MNIGWYPGHMNKARKDITKTLQSVDAVIEILDARLPWSSANPMLDQLIGDIPRLNVLNKSDLADPEITQEWMTYFDSNALSKAITLDKSQTSAIRNLAHYCFQHFRKPEKKRFKIMILGIPNVGKSTIMNIILDRKIAKVGNEPAVTKNRQEIKLTEQILLMDTPGILWPKIEPQDSAYRLAATGAIKNTAFEFEDIALWLIDYLENRYQKVFRQRYELEGSYDNSTQILERIGINRGCLKKGGVDWTKTGEILLNDFRSGKIAPISLERPIDIPPIEEIKVEEAPNTIQE